MDQADKLRQRAALGYIELGMLGEAKAELEGLSEGASTSVETNILRLRVAQCEKSWGEARYYAGLLRRHQPGEPEWAIMLAYAIRRCEDIPAARKVLLEALTDFPKEAVIHFNLACYACQLGDLPKARDYLNRALDLDRSYLDLALSDDDLAAMHEELRAMQ